VPFLVEAQAAPQGSFVVGFFLGDFTEQSFQFWIVGLLGQRHVALPSLQLMGDGQFDGLNDVQFRFGFGFEFGWFDCHTILGGPAGIVHRVGFKLRELYHKLLVREDQADLCLNFF
jgi:hypothetical protein